MDLFVRLSVQGQRYTSGVKKIFFIETRKYQFVIILEGLLTVGYPAVKKLRIGDCSSVRTNSFFSHVELLEIYSTWLLQNYKKTLILYIGESQGLMDLLRDKEQRNEKEDRWPYGPLHVLSNFCETQARRAIQLFTHLRSFLDLQLWFTRFLSHKIFL